MNKREAKEWYCTVVKDGLGDIRTKFFEGVENMEWGYVGEIAKDKLDDPLFRLGLEFGVMIALDRIYGFKK